MASAGRAFLTTYSHMNDSHGEGCYSDRKCHSTPSHLQPASSSQKPTTGTSNIANCPLGCPQLLGHLLKCGSPNPGPQIARPSRLTSAGVIHAPIIDQHFVKEDNTRITGERLLGEPRRERHQRRHWNPWNREDEGVHR